MTSTSNTNYLNLLQRNMAAVYCDKVPGVSFLAQFYNLPGIDLDTIVPFSVDRDFKLPGSTIRFTPLRVNFILDRDMQAWYEVYQWFKDLVGSGNPENHTNAGVNKALSLIQLFILRPSNSGNAVINRVMNLSHAFPSSIGEAYFDTTITGAEYLSMIVEFQFTELTITASDPKVVPLSIDPCLQLATNIFKSNQESSFKP